MEVKGSHVGEEGQAGMGRPPWKASPGKQTQFPISTSPCLSRAPPRLSLHLMGTHWRGPLLPPSLASEAAKLEWEIASKARLGLSGSCTHPGAKCAPGRPGCMGANRTPRPNSLSAKCLLGSSSSPLADRATSAKDSGPATQTGAGSECVLFWEKMAFLRAQADTRLEKG